MLIQGGFAAANPRSPWLGGLNRGKFQSALTSKTRLRGAGGAAAVTPGWAGRSAVLASNFRILRREGEANSTFASRK
jgi:hypothetical protein